MKKFITEEEINTAWGYANFGDTPKIDVIKDGLLKCVCGFYQGHTSKSILEDLGLIEKEKYILTEKGKYTLYELFGFDVV